MDRVSGEQKQNRLSLIGPGPSADHDGRVTRYLCPGSLAGRGVTGRETRVSAGNEPGERVRLSGSSRGEAPRLLLDYRYGDSNPGPVAENHVS
jgi:hypothetical protein